MHITLYIIILANNVNFISYIANLDQFYAISVYSQVGYPWGLLLHFPPLQLCPCHIFHSRIFSRPHRASIPENQLLCCRVFRSHELSHLLCSVLQHCRRVLHCLLETFELLTCQDEHTILWPNYCAAGPVQAGPVRTSRNRASEPIYGFTSCCEPFQRQVQYI